MTKSTTEANKIQLPSDQDASGRTFDDCELANLKEALESGILTSTKGHFVKDLENAFAELHGSPHALACASWVGRNSHGGGGRRPGTG